MADSEEVLPGYKDAQELSQTVLQAVMGSLKSSSGVPNAGADFEYYSTFRGFNAIMQKEKNAILSLMKSLIPGQKIRDQFEQYDVEDKFDVILDMNASILENVGNQLDEATSTKKTTDDELVLATKTVLPINTSWNRVPKKMLKCSQNYTLFSAKNIQRPQITFKEPVDNSNSPFVPSIKEKPNATKPLAILVEKIAGKEQFSHPYEWEIEHFQPAEEQLDVRDPICPHSIEETPLIFVDTEEKLGELVADLRCQTEFALDIENHSYRSFQGFSCLIQISTREKDYIIDAIKLRSELHVLNEVLTDPKIVKVLHGADMDVLWLQRDFSLYIVNLFDTGQASRVLNFAHLSLAYLLKHYCNLEVDKQFQLADWRIRPLPPPLIKYAREDTHYLLYVYDCIKNDLLKKGNGTRNLLMSVIQRSKDICLKKYEKLIFNDKMYLDVYKKGRKLFNARQLFCLKELCSWRDKLARIEDESYGYILPNHMLLRIAETMPKEPEGIIACCNPVPPLVRQQLNELHVIVTKANNCPLNMLESKEPDKISKIDKPIDSNNILHSLHDIHHSKNQKIRKFAIQGNKTSFDLHNFTCVQVPLKEKLALPLRRTWLSTESKNTSHQQTAENVAKSIAEDNKSPYERYLLTKQYRGFNNPRDEEATVNQEHLSKNFIEVINLSSNTISSDGLSPNVSLQSENEIPDSHSNTSILDTPILSKKKKHKKKDDVHSESASETPRIKKSKLKDTPNFQAFDYSQADTSILKNKQKSNKNTFKFNESSVQNKRFGKTSWKKKKDSGKQTTFNPNSSKSASKSWPKH